MKETQGREGKGAEKEREKEGWIFTAHYVPMKTTSEVIWATEK